MVVHRVVVKCFVPFVNVLTLRFWNLYGAFSLTELISASHTVTGRDAVSSYD